MAIIETRLEELRNQISSRSPKAPAESRSIPGSQPKSQDNSQEAAQDATPVLGGYLYNYFTQT